VKDHSAGIDDSPQGGPSSGFHVSEHSIEECSEGGTRLTGRDVLSGVFENPPHTFDDHVMAFLLDRFLHFLSLEELLDTGESAQFVLHV
jgi:hypothetical protein